VTFQRGLHMIAVGGIPVQHSWSVISPWASLSGKLCDESTGFKTFPAVQCVRFEIE